MVFPVTVSVSPGTAMPSGPSPGEVTGGALFLAVLAAALGGQEATGGGLASADGRVEPPPDESRSSDAGEKTRDVVDGSALALAGALLPLLLVEAGRAREVTGETAGGTAEAPLPVSQSLPNAAPVRTATVPLAPGALGGSSDVPAVVAENGVLAAASSATPAHEFTGVRTQPGELPVQDAVASDAGVAAPGRRPPLGVASAADAVAGASPHWPDGLEEARAAHGEVDPRIMSRFDRNDRVVGEAWHSAGERSMHERSPRGPQAVEQVPGEPARVVPETAAALGRQGGEDVLVATRAVEQVEREVGHALERGVRQLRVRLEPPDLGVVDIRVRDLGGRLEVVLAASRPDVQQALEAGREGLRTALAANGFSVQRLEVQPATTASGQTTMGSGESGMTWGGDRYAAPGDAGPGRWGGFGPAELTGRDEAAERQLETDPSRLVDTRA